MQSNFWNVLDSVTHAMGRTARHGNGKIRVVLACIILVAMFLYPFFNL